MLKAVPSLAVKRPNCLDGGEDTSEKIKDMMGYYGYGPGMWLLGGLMMLLIWGGLVVLVVWAVRQSAPGQRPAVEDPMAILRRRLAAGDITQEQFDQARRALQS
jgi:putative membrane protein